jgi:hypothetical protein
MRFQRSVLALICASISLVFANPTGAIASELLPAFSADFTLNASNGYLISTVAENDKVQLTVSHGRLSRKNFTFTTYKAPASVSWSRIVAGLGDLGELSLHFQPSGKVRITYQRKPKGCKGSSKIVRRLGTFTGAIRFEGEEGYTSIETDHVEGSVGTPTTITCSFTGSFSEGGHRHKRHHRPKGAYLGATVTGNTLGFAASRSGPNQHSDFVARSTEKAGPVSITRYATATGAPQSFTFDNRFSSATVTPPLPFTGTAEYHRGRNPIVGSWTGSLAVTFLGAANVPLTGPAFTTALLEPGG